MKVLGNMEEKGSIGWFLHKTQRDKSLEEVAVDIVSGEKTHVVMLKGVLACWADWYLINSTYNTVKFNAAHLNLIKKN